MRPTSPTRRTGASERSSVSGHEDPDGESPWAMQLVVRVERASPPERQAVCECAAMAVVALLADERSAPGGEWYPAVARWEAGRIRKLVRRARGAQWRHVQELDGTTVARRGAEVRAFVPGPVDDVPRELARLQLQGFDLPEATPADTVEPEPGGPPVVSLSPLVALSAGKAAAAAGHAAQLSLWAMDGARRAAWASLGWEVLVEEPAAARWNEEIALAPVVVEDGGFTEVAPGTVTALARWR